MYLQWEQFLFIHYGIDTCSTASMSGMFYELGMITLKNNFMKPRMK